MNTVAGESYSAPELQFILKVASRCNLNCSYCYVYNKGDESWRQRPEFMPRNVFDAALARIKTHCRRSGQTAVRITFHGGEPCLAGPDMLSEWFERAHEVFADTCRLELSLQTNGTLIDRRWADLFRRHNVSVGVSLDGPASINDAARVNHAGRGTHSKIVRAINMLRDGGVSWQILCVLQFGVDSLRVHRHFLELGAKRIHYLLPDFTHDSIVGMRRVKGSTPCADYLMPILEDWWSNGSLDVRIGIFWNMARVILGGNTQLDLFGNASYRYAFVETEGSIEGLDVLRICGAGLSTTGLHVLRDEFGAIADASPLHRAVMFEGVALPTGCRSCTERSTCGGGYLPHRFSSRNGLDNPSIWCEDMLLLFGRMREMLGVTSQETIRRRAMLEEIMTDESKRSTKSRASGFASSAVVRPLNA